MKKKKLRQTGKRIGQMAKSESCGLPLMNGGLKITSVQKVQSPIT